MNTHQRPPSEESLMILTALRTAVTKDLDKKKKLGQYAVFWENGEIVFKRFDEDKKTS